MKSISKFIALVAASLVLLMPLFANAQQDSLWKVNNSKLTPVNVNWGLRVTSLGSANVPCVTVDSLGNFGTTTGACGSGGGSAYPFPLNPNGTSTLTYFQGGINAVASSTIGSVNFNSNGNMGIGTTTPWAMLSLNPNGISGPAFAVGSSTKTTAFQITNGGEVVMRNSNITNTTLKLNDAGMYFSRNTDGAYTSSITSSQGSAPSITIAAQGNVIIQPSSATYTFDGTGVITATGFTASGGVFKTSANTNARIAADPAAGTDNQGIEFGVGVRNAQGNNALTSWYYNGFAASGGTEVARMTTAGRFGLGSSTPWANLSINNSTADSSGQPLLAIASSTASATTTLLVVTNTGNLGIGTTTPSGTLAVQGNTLISGNITSVANIVATGTLAVGSSISAGTSVSANTVFAASGSATALSTTGGVSAQSGNYITGANIDLALSASNALTKNLLIKSSTGFIGMGTTTPAWNLQVAGTRPYLTLSDTSAGLDSKHWFMTSQGGNLYMGTSSDLFATTTYMTVANGGNVGVGITNPVNKFQIDTSNDSTSYSPTMDVTVPSGSIPLRIRNSNASADFTALELDTRNSGSSIWRIVNKYQSSTNGDLAFQTRSGSNASIEVMRMLNNGNVGVNTTSAGRKFEVLDTANPQFRLTYTGGSVYTDFQTDSTGLLTIAPTGNRVIVQGTSATVVSTLVNYNTTGGTGAGSGFLFASGGATSFIGGVASARSDNTTTNSILAFRVLAAGSITGADTTAPFYIQGLSAGGGNSIFNGGVGISTSTPYAKLSVVTGDLTTDPLVVATSTGAELFKMDKTGYRILEGDTPSVSSCGTGAYVIGTDSHGTIFAGTGVITSCTLTFAYSHAPKNPLQMNACTVTPATGTFSSVLLASTTATTMVASGPTLTSDAFTYDCALAGGK